MSAICLSYPSSWEAANKPCQAMYDWRSSLWMNAALAMAWFSSVIEQTRAEPPDTAGRQRASPWWCGRPFRQWSWVAKVSCQFRSRR